MPIPGQRRGDLAAENRGDIFGRPRFVQHVSSEAGTRARQCVGSRPLLSLMPDCTKIVDSLSSGKCRRRARAPPVKSPDERNGGPPALPARRLRSDVRAGPDPPVGRAATLPRHRDSRHHAASSPGAGRGRRRMVTRDRHALVGPLRIILSRCGRESIEWLLEVRPTAESDRTARTSAERHRGTVPMRVWLASALSPDLVVPNRS